MKKGISLVALIITIIVLITLTSAVVLTGINTTQEAQLAVFYNNVSTMQEAVQLKINNNITEYALKGIDNLEIYKWVGVVENYTESNAKSSINPTFDNTTINEISVAKIDNSIKNNISISDEEFEKYYISNNGTVYYEGFLYKGITYYNRVVSSQSIITPTPTTLCLTDGTYNTQEQVNSPKLLEGMVGIYWNNDNEEITSNSPEWNYSDWYNYQDKLYANAKTPDGSYWVWIPRFAYRINSGFNTSTTGAIDIKFLKDTSYIASDNTSIDSCTEGNGFWNQHSGFKYTGNDNLTYELPGFWVSKYDMSGTDSSSLKSVPNGSIFISSSVSTLGMAGINYNPNYNSHTTKTEEWGALCCLSHSPYGSNGEFISSEMVSNGNITGLYNLNGGFHLTALTCGDWGSYFNNDIRFYTRIVYGSYIECREATRTLFGSCLYECSGAPTIDGYPAAWTGGTSTVTGGSDQGSLRGCTSMFDANWTKADNYRSASIKVVLW
ncbi:MAG: hypothetical protein PHH22_03985 [Clostridia bacterium]|nr:hypothetical protein [Clostridia bacterium]